MSEYWHSPRDTHVRVRRAGNRRARLLGALRALDRFGETVSLSDVGGLWILLLCLSGVPIMPRGVRLALTSVACGLVLVVVTRQVRAKVRFLILHREHPAWIWFAVLLMVLLVTIQVFWTWLIWFSP